MGKPVCKILHTMCDAHAEAFNTCSKSVDVCFDCMADFKKAVPQSRDSPLSQQTIRWCLKHTMILASQKLCQVLRSVMITLQRNNAASLLLNSYDTADNVMFQGQLRAKPCTGIVPMHKGCRGLPLQLCELCLGAEPYACVWTLSCFKI